MALTVEEAIVAASQLSENDRRRLIEALKAAEPGPRHSTTLFRVPDYSESSQHVAFLTSTEGISQFPQAE